MNIPWTPAGALSFEPPVPTPSGYVALRAELDLVIAFPACPQEILPINGLARQPTEAHFVEESRQQASRSNPSWPG